MTNEKTLPIYEMTQLQEVAELFRREELVAFPTETVFGLGAIATSEQAVNKVFQAKGRPSDNPLIVHVSSIEQVGALVSHVSALAEQLMTRFWPGALTIVFPAREGVLPANALAHKSTVAIRMPNQSETLQLIEAVGIPLVGPSANLSGRPSPTLVEHVVQDFTGKIAGVLRPSQVSSEIGVESTVVYPKDDGIYILRPGGVTADDLATLGVPVIEMTVQQQLSHATLHSPGVKYRHYSPIQPVYIMPPSSTVGEWQVALEHFTQQGQRVGVMAFEDVCHHLSQATSTYSLGKANDSHSATRHLYAGLRSLEKDNVDLMLVQGLDDTQVVNHAYMNRLTKAGQLLPTNLMKG